MIEDIIDDTNDDYKNMLNSLVKGKLYGISSQIIKLYIFIKF